MKISYNWLRERFFDGDLDPAPHLAALITRNAFEVESIDENEGDTVLDIKVLPNRAHDCMSHEGIARELAVLSGDSVSYKPERANVSKKLKTADHVHLSISDGVKCYRASKRLVTGVKIGESPQWLKSYLQAVGQKPINNVVDVANFVMLETGQPVHTFDYDKIAGPSDGPKQITIRNARAGEIVVGLDGKTYTLDESVMVIADEARALDIAGIKGGADSGVGPETTRVLLSACNFDAVMIRQTAKKLGLRTDASARFEQEITPEFVMPAMELLAAIIQETAGGDVAADILDVYPEPVQPHTVGVSQGDIERVLGVSMSEKEIGAVLTRMNFPWHEEKGGGLTVTVPPSRIDVRITEDVVEEVERLLGYDTLPSTPLSPGPQPVPHKTPFYTEKIRHALVDAGFSEVYTYALTNKGDVELAHPPASDKVFLRSCVLPGINAALALNIPSADLLGLDRIRVFEMGTIFKKDEEIYALGIGIQSVRKEKDAILAQELDRALDALTVFCPTLKTSAEIFTEKGRVTARVNLSKVFTESPTPRVYESFTPFSSAQYQKISPYPYIVRDVAVFMPEGTTADVGWDVILPLAGDLVVHHYLFDRFEKTMPDGTKKVSYGFRLIFQAADRTLTDAEVASHMEKVTAALQAQEGWEVR